MIDLPASFEELTSEEREEVARFLRWAEAAGARNGYIARHRTPWWRVGLTPPAPIVMTYMARQAPVFVRNLAGARLLNIAHGLYPRRALPAAALDRLTDLLNANADRMHGRVYSGGLRKLEPGDVMTICIPELEEATNVA